MFVFAHKCMYFLNICLISSPIQSLTHSGLHQRPQDNNLLAIWYQGPRCPNPSKHIAIYLDRTLLVNYTPSDNILLVKVLEGCSSVEGLRFLALLVGCEEVV